MNAPSPADHFPEIRQPHRPFRSAAYRCVRASDRIPVLDELENDPLMRAKLFSAGTWTLYIAAITYYDDRPVATGRLATGEGLDGSWGDCSMRDVVARRAAFGLPVERDLHWEPRRWSVLRAELSGAPRL